MRSRFVAVVLLGLMGLWMVVAGVVALATGSYPDIGAGDWSEVAQTVGVDAASLAVRVLHVLVGLVAIGAAFAIATGWGALAWWMGVIASVAVLWRVPAGTIAGGVSLVVLLLPGPRLAIRGD